MKRFSDFLNELLKDNGINYTLFFILIELMYTNSKSFYYLDSTSTLGNDGWLGWQFSIIGGIGVSFVSTVVMRRPHHLKAKKVLPIFDGVFVFCAYNINLFTDFEAGTINPVRVLLSLGLAVFTGYSIYVMGELSNSESLHSNSTELQRNYDSLQRNYTELQRNNDSLQRKYSEMESKFKIYERSHYDRERARILKKLEKNRTAEENKILELTN